MFTRCPACHTLFRIQPQQLKAARGQVRCGSCQAIFDGLDFLVNREDLSKEELSAIAMTSGDHPHQRELPFNETSIPNNPPDEEVDPAESVKPQSAKNAPPPPSNETRSVEVQAAIVETSAAVEPEAKIPALPKEPVKIRLKPPRYSLADTEPEALPRRTAARIGWTLGSLLMIALLAGQIAFHNRNSLALDPRWRPWLQMACNRIGCVLPPQRDPRAIEMVDRNVQSHPQFQNALLITATLVNQAPFAQPYPQVELAMTDLDQRKVASRRFLPSEYVDGSDGKVMIPPGASVRLRLEIVDPGQQAVGFEFEFF